MKLYHSANSPFVRKVVICAELLGLSNRIELIPAKGDPLVRDAQLRALNPSGQIPTLITDDGTVLFDSNVICEYLDDLGGGKVFGSGQQRWTNLRDAALGDLLTESGLQVRYEIGMRAQALRWDAWEEAWLGKIDDVLAHLDERAEQLQGRTDIGPVAICCALIYFDWRLESLRWSELYPRLGAWFKEFRQHPAVKFSCGEA
jgi:glutathione S-transferase